MFIFSKVNLFHTRYLLPLFFVLIGSFSFGQKIDYSAGKISATDDGGLILENSVSLQIDDLSVSTEKLFFTQETRSGFSESLSFIIEENNFWGEAEKLNFSENEISFQNASFSLCPCLEKIWWIEASEISFSEDTKSVNFKDARLKVQGKTIGAWPKGSFPASSKRKSGFLLPEINISNKSGIDASIPYYLNLKENLDATIEPRYISKRGFGISNELRYLSDKFNGILNSSILSNDKEYEDQYMNNSFRWSFNLQHSQSLKEDLFLQIKYANVSDTFFLNDFGGDFNGTSKTLYTPQQLILSNFSKTHKAIIKINSFRIVDPIGQDQFKELPRVELSWFNKNEFLNYGIDSFFSLFKKGGSFISNSSESIEMYHLTPYLISSKKINNLSSEYEAKINFTKFNFNGLSIKRTQPEVNIRFHSDLTKKDSTIEKFIRPFALISYSPQKNQNEIPYINSGIFLNQRNFLETRLISRNYLLEKKDISIGFIHELYNIKGKLFELQFAKKFSSMNSLRISNQDYELPEPFNIDLKYFPNKRSSFNLGIKVDDKDKFNTLNLVYKQNLALSSFALNYFWAKDINAFLLNSTSEKKINQIDFEFKLKGNYKYDLSTKFIYDLENSNLTNAVLGLEYENPGLRYGVALIHSKELDWAKVLNENIYDDYNQESFRIYFELKGLGSLGRPLDNYLNRRTLN